MTLKKELAVLLAATTAVGVFALTACSPSESKSPDNKPANDITITKTEVMQACDVDYIWGETFDPTDLALKVTFSNNKTANVTSGFTFERKGNAAITAPLTADDTKVTVKYTAKLDGKSYDGSYELAITTNDPHGADVLLFKGTGNDATYMYGDGTLFGVGVQGLEWAPYTANYGKWCWTGTDLYAVMYLDAGKPAETPTVERTRRVEVTKGADGSYSFATYWGRFPMFITIPKEKADIFLTASNKFGDQQLAANIANYQMLNIETDLPKEDAGGEQ